MGKRGTVHGARRHRQAGVTAALLTVVLTVVLAGCSLTAYPEIPRDADSGGQTQDDLDETLADLTGLQVTHAAGSNPNAKGNTGYGFDLELDPGYQIVDAPGLVTFLVESAWSVRDGYLPNTTVEIRLDAGPLPSDKIDIVGAAEESGWVPVGSQSHRIGEDGGSMPEYDNGYSSVSVWLDSDSTSATVLKRGGVANRDRLGEWPGVVPEVPEGLTALIGG